MRKVSIGIEINNSAARDVLGGILKYVSTHNQWNVKIFSHPETLSAQVIRRAKEDGFDGIIVNHINSQATADELQSVPIPVAVAGIEQSRLPNRRMKVAFINNKNDLVGALGAQKFLSLGKFQSFVFVSHPEKPAWSEDRKDGFCAELKRHKIVPVVLSGDFADELMRQPRPTAVMAAWDYKAIEVLEFCRARGLHVPDDVSVIGVDADPLICGFTNPPLSSVAPDFERLGYCAAAALDAMMAGRKLRVKNIVLCRPKGLIERTSTRFLPPAAALLHHAKEIIERDAVHGLTVQGLALRLGVSQQLLALRFRQFEKRSVRETILNAKLNHVKAKLKHPYVNLAAIAKECGFNSSNRLAHLFKQRFGISPGAFAQQVQATTSE